MNATSSLRLVSSESPRFFVYTSSIKFFGRKTFKLELSRILSMMLLISSKTNLNMHLISFIPIYGNYSGPWVIQPRNFPSLMVALFVLVHLCVHRRFSTFIFQSLEKYVPNIQSERVKLLQDH